MFNSPHLGQLEETSITVPSFCDSVSSLVNFFSVTNVGLNNISLVLIGLSDVGDRSRLGLHWTSLDSDIKSQLLERFNPFGQADRIQDVFMTTKKLIKYFHI